MPHLVSLTSQYATQGLKVIASHVQKAAKEEIKGLCRKNRVNYTVVQSARVKGDKSRSIPHVFLFDHTGACVWQGSAAGATQQLKEVMARAPHPLLAGLELKKLEKINAAMKKGYSCGKVLKRLTSSVSSSDEETAKEAKAIVERLLAHAKKLEEKSENLRTEDPYRCYATLVEIKKEFAGTEPAKEAAAKLKALAKDRDFMLRYNAGKLAASIRTIGEQLRPVGRGAVDMSDPACLKANLKSVRKMAALFKQLQTKYQDTTYCEETRKYLQELGIKV